MEDIDSLEMILNLCLSKAMCRKGRIQHPNSNNIAEFVSNFLKEENLSGSQKVRNSTDPALNLHGVNDLLVDFQHYLVLDGALDIDEDEIKRNAEVYSTNRR